MQFSVRPAALKVKSLTREASMIDDKTDNVSETQAEKQDEQKEEEKSSEAPAEKEEQPVEAEATKQVDERNFDDKLGWREALGFEHPLKGWQHLWIRFATD